MWTRAVWKEASAEMEEVIPSCWVNNGQVSWPDQGVKRALKSCKEPEDAWMTFPLIKVKIHSDNKKERENHDCTTTAELSCSEEEPLKIPAKRKPKKKTYPDFQIDDPPVSDMDNVETVAVTDLKKCKNTDDLPLPPVPKNVQKIVQSGRQWSSDSDSQSRDKNMKKNGSKSDGQSTRGLERGLRQISHPTSQFNRKRSLSTELSSGGKRRCMPYQNSDTRERSENARSKVSTPKLKTSNFPLSEEKFQKKVLQMLIEIRDLVKIATTSPDGTTFKVKPAITKKDYEELESRLSDDKETAALKAHLRRLGGVDAVDMVKKCMAATLSNAMMAQMSLKGRCGKLAFCNSVLCQIICDAVISTHNTTQSNIQGVISRYLKYAPERMGGGGRKKAIKNV